MYFLIVAAILVFAFYVWKFIERLPEIQDEYKRFKGITLETASITILILVTMFFIFVSIYFMWLYADGVIDLALLKGEDDLVKHLPDLC